MRFACSAAAVRSNIAGATSFVWDVAGKVFPQEALDGVDHVVHLAGANVGQRWTAAHKNAILKSRTEGTALLANALAQAGFSGTFIQASAIGLYGECHERRRVHPQGRRVPRRRHRSLGVGG